MQDRNAVDFATFNPYHGNAQGNIGTVIEFANALAIRQKLISTMQLIPGIIQTVLEKENTIYAMTFVHSYLFKILAALITPEHLHHANFIKQVLHSMLWLGYAAVTINKYGELVCVPPTEYTVLSRFEYSVVFNGSQYSGLSWRKSYDEYRCIFASDVDKKRYSFTGFGPPIVLVSPFNAPPIAGMPCSPISRFDWISPAIILFYQSTMALYIQSACRQAFTPSGAMPTMSAFVKAAGATQMSSTVSNISQKFASMTKDSMDTIHKTAQGHLKEAERAPNVDDMLQTSVTAVDSTHVAFAPTGEITAARMSPINGMDILVLNAYGISPNWINLGHSSDRSAHVNLAECVARNRLSTVVRQIVIGISHILNDYALETGRIIPFVSGNPADHPMDMEMILEISHLLTPECTGRLLERATFGQITPDDIRQEEIKSIVDKRRPLDVSSS